MHKVTFWLITKGVWVGGEGLSKRRRDDVTGDVTLHTRVNGRRRIPESGALLGRRDKLRKVHF